jgi:hypothetical protein
VDETIFRFWRITRETGHDYQRHNDDTLPATGTWRQSMRALSLVLAFGLVLGGSSYAGAPDGKVPGIGTFQYSGSQVTTAAPQSIVLAVRF